MDKVRTSSFLAMFGEGVTMETRIEDLSMDSLEFLELLQEIGAKFGQISNEAATRASTVKELYDALPA